VKPCPVEKMRLKNLLKRVRDFLLIKSLEISNKQREENDLKKRLSKIVPDLKNQYTTFTIDMNDKYLTTKVRCQHTFQMTTLMKAVQLLVEKQKKEKIFIVDIGDSSGTHILYLNELLKEHDIEANTLSVNIDPLAIDKIKNRGLNAVLCKAEELHEHNIEADIFFSFEMIEHLFDPISFLYIMSSKTKCDYFVITVPYVQRSRVGLEHVRYNINKEANAESIHIFELCPFDWNLIFKFTGWKILHADCYTQYPKRGMLNLLKYEWRRFDFDGFYGVILERDHRIKNQYKSW
jgi:hypothetical protein